MTPARAASHPDQEGTFSMASSHTLDQLDTCFDDTHAIANAGLLRCGATSRVLGHRVMAPSTLGTFLRAFTFGHVRQLDRLTETVLARAWTAGAGPGDGPMTIDLDSTVCEVHGHHKQGAAYGYTHTLGYHPLLASRADGGEVLHARQRTGRANTARGAARFVDEVAGRVRRAGASGELTMRMDSGFWSAKTIRACRRHRIRHSITVRQTKPIRAAITAIDEQAWVEIVYPEGGLAQVAETRYQGDRLIVRRTRLVGAQAELFPNWRYHAFVTDRVGTTVWLDQDHRRHAVVELCIRDLKAGVGLRHCPSGKFNANAAWLAAATLAHNLLRWVAQLGLGTHEELVVAKALLRLVSPRHGELGDSRLALDHQRELVKRDRHAPGHRRLDRQLVMPSTNVLDQGVAGDHDPGAAVLLEPAHRTKSCLQAAVVGLNPVVGVLLGVVPRRRQQLLQDDRVGRRLIGHDLAWHGPRRADSPLEESTGRPQIAPWRDEHVDDLPELIDRTIDIAPAASHLHIGLVCLPAVPDRVPAGPGRLAQ
jgi:Transposase DDE domain group 1